MFRLAGWLLLSICVAAVRGFGFPSAAWAAALLPVALAPGKVDPGPVSAILLGVAAITPGTGLFTLLVGVSAFLVVWQSKSALWRGAGALSAMICAGLLFFGLPGVESSGIPTAQEMHRQGSTVWKHVPSLDSGSPSVSFRISRGGTILISIEAGGIRDTDPVGMIRVGEREIRIHEGFSTHEIELEASDSTVVVEMTRSWRPFEHPVIHFDEVMLIRGEQQ